MFAIEAVVDKIPYVDTSWDVISTAVRPAIGTLLGIQFAEADHAAHEAAVAGGTGATALISHGIKASLRLGINASPEPVTNFIASVFEDITAGLLATLAVTYPLIAASIVGVLFVVGLLLVWFIHTRIRRAWRRYRQWRQDRGRGRGRAARPP